jgi:hypothetical protein
VAADEQRQLLGDPVEELAALAGRHTDELAELSQRLADVRSDVDALLADHGGRGHTPVPAPRWHELEGEARDAAIARLRGWVEHIFRPVYGHLAANLGPCWAEHGLALVVLDHLSETWAVLFARETRPQRVLSAQLEFLLRYLPAAADMLRAETLACRKHGQRRPGAAA